MMNDYLSVNKNSQIDVKEAGLNVEVVISAYNEERNIGPIIRDIIELGYSCIVVDDGSTDRTSEIASSNGAKILRHSINLGQGFGLLTGFKAALMEENDIIVEMDGDGQHDPNEIPKFIEAFKKYNCDIVVGSRILGSTHSNAPLFRRMFLPVYTYIINVITGYKLTDSMCGFRAFKTSSLRRVYFLFDQMLEPEYIAAEMFIRFSRSDLTVIEIPVYLRNRISGKSYKGFIKYGLGVLKAITKTLWG